MRLAREDILLILVVIWIAAIAFSAGLYLEEIKAIMPPKEDLYIAAMLILAVFNFGVISYLGFRLASAIWNYLAKKMNGQHASPKVLRPERDVRIINRQPAPKKAHRASDRSNGFLLTPEGWVAHLSGVREMDEIGRDEYMGEKFEDMTIQRLEFVARQLEQFGYVPIDDLKNYVLYRKAFL